MPSATSPIHDATEPSVHTKLILCFDGTGNTFSGTNADTNVVKILRKLDRNHKHQFHYYQTGIGTYDVNETSIHKGFLGEMRSSISKSIDQGFGTTFDAHIMAGYRFLMRYYKTDARIYIFGFSRGAFTAKYLSRMINKVGLLCKGNEEMVAFAYRLYQRSLECESADRVAAQKAEQKRTGAKHYKNGPSECEPLLSNGRKASHPKDQLLAGDAPLEKSEATKAALKEMTAFSETFCRNSGESFGAHKNIKVFFLGIWDCVNSVAVVEKNAPAPVEVTGTARHIRHAVAVDERRVKFKPALLAQDIRNTVHNAEPTLPARDMRNGVQSCRNTEDIVEVWFPGNHGDIGGGWPAIPLKDPKDMNLFERIKYYWTTLKPKNLNVTLEDDRLQLSDMALDWMIREVELVGQKEPASAVHWLEGSLAQFKGYMETEEKKHVDENVFISGFMHDCLSFGYGTALFKVLMWKFMEIMPFIPRWELNDTAEKEKDKGWEPYRGLPNFGASRDIPRRAILHNSLKQRLEDNKDYNPKNNHGDGKPCLRIEGKDAPSMTKAPVNEEVGEVTGKEASHEARDARHRIWQLA
ncbi:hypothetical protein F66182_6008 [Fusarium sp. NRRL 66182]|nr:hypothetical protein F66182_6008 [Fusarium sp. NRRL 66182]